MKTNGPIFVTELPCTVRGDRLLTNHTPRVIKVETIPKEERGPRGEFYRTVSPKNYATTFGTICISSWVQVDGPCRELLENEYVEMLEVTKNGNGQIKDWHLEAARHRAKFVLK